MSFEWKIKRIELKGMQNAENGKTFESPTFNMFGTGFSLSLSPNGRYKRDKGIVVFSIYNETQQNQKMTFTRIKLATAVSFIEINKETFNTVSMDANKPCPTVTTDIEFSDIKQCQKLTVKCEADLVQALDADNNDITHLFGVNPAQTSVSTTGASQLEAKVDEDKWVSLKETLTKINAKIDTMEKRINDIELMVKEERKSNNNSSEYDYLLNEMKMMKEHIAKLSVGSEVNSEQQELRNWLGNKCKLPQYYDTFVDNGIEDLSVVALLDKSTLKDIGVDKVGHQMKILNEAEKLKGNVADIAVKEGKTEYI